MRRLHSPSIGNEQQKETMQMKHISSYVFYTRLVNIKCLCLYVVEAQRAQSLHTHAD